MNKITELLTNQKRITQMIKGFVMDLLSSNCSNSIFQCSSQFSQERSNNAINQALLSILRLHQKRCQYNCRTRTQLVARHKKCDLLRQCTHILSVVSYQLEAAIKLTEPYSLPVAVIITYALYLKRKKQQRDLPGSSVNLTLTSNKVSIQLTNQDSARNKAHEMRLAATMYAHIVSCIVLI
ncbi:hypothetical protein B9Z55_014314 [Caenorhabditis nigoni]|uniref:Uncharacterized protein n=1 Tax=Caenorhabditis nigoni TaxID=1611254 RepID=A0A2G5U5H3_9PELO|nr:hypothetical protein B9Z55_014314 [Caenorhabditis nigoni]